MQPFLLADVVPIQRRFGQTERVGPGHIFKAEPGAFQPILNIQAIITNMITLSEMLVPFFRRDNRGIFVGVDSIEQVSPLGILMNKHL